MSAEEDRIFANELLIEMDKRGAGTRKMAEATEVVGHSWNIKLLKGLGYSIAELAQWAIRGGPLGGILRAN